ncbi:hypothetical protein BDZ91DRAFT_742181, partial [Kalaharituber pfeilii]
CHPNKKRNAILLAVAARGVKRRATMELDTSELVVPVEEGISRPFVYKSVDESARYDEQEIQDLSMTVDVYMCT